MGGLLWPGRSSSRCSQSSSPPSCNSRRSRRTLQGWNHRPSMSGRNRQRPWRSHTFLASPAGRLRSRPRSLMCPCSRYSPAPGHSCCCCPWSPSAATGSKRLRREDPVYIGEGHLRSRGPSGAPRSGMSGKKWRSAGRSGLASSSLRGRSLPGPTPSTPGPCGSRSRRWGSSG